jgi:hypothetical protein
MQPGGYLVLRFRANNPGILLFHCRKLLVALSHKANSLIYSSTDIEWHAEAGLTATMIEGNRPSLRE